MTYNKRERRTPIRWIWCVIFIVCAGLASWIFWPREHTTPSPSKPTHTPSTQLTGTQQDAAIAPTIKPEKTTEEEKLAKQEHKKDIVKPASKKPSTTCSNNQCLYRNKCHTLPAHATCTQNDPRNARTCDKGYRDTGTSCVLQTVVKPQPNTNVKKTKTIMGHDVYSDSSLTKFICRWVPFNNKGYIPRLTTIQPSKTIKTRGTKKLRPEAYTALQKMAQAFYADMHQPLVVYSSYRSYLYQKNSISQSCKNNGRCARWGESEHQSGLTVDLRSVAANTATKYRKQFAWLKANAHKYGWHQSYQKGKAIDGYHTEAWHWRYLGTDLATTLHNKGMTFSELYNTH